MAINNNRGPIPVLVNQGRAAPNDSNNSPSLPIQKLGNVTESPLNDKEVSAHKPKIACFALRSAMGMKLSRLELADYSVDKIKSLNAPDSLRLFNRLEKTMHSSSNYAKSVHIMLLFNELSTSKDNGRLPISAADGNEPSKKADKRLGGILTQLEKNGNKHGSFNLLLKKLYDTKCKNYPFIDTKSEAKFEKSCCFKNISTKELESLSVDIILKQSPSDLMEFLQRAQETIKSTKNPDKSLRITSLLLRLYNEESTFKSAVLAGNRDAIKLNTVLQEVMLAPFPDGSTELTDAYQNVLSDLQSTLL